LVPGVGPFSNVLFANLHEFIGLQESLKREGVLGETWETLVLPLNGESSTPPFSSLNQRS
jgi:hypothetical protein